MTIKVISAAMVACGLIIGSAAAQAHSGDDRVDTALAPNPQICPQHELLIFAVVDPIEAEILCTEPL